MHAHRAPTALVRVLYADTDQMGVVNNVVYLRYFELGRAEWLRGRGMTYKQIESGGLMLPVVEAYVRYKLPARYDDLLAIDVEVDDLRAASVQFRYVIHRAEDRVVLVEGTTKHACVGADGKVLRLPEHLLSILRPEA